MFSKRQVLVLDSAKPSMIGHLLMSVFVRSCHVGEGGRRTGWIEHSLDSATDAGGGTLDDEGVAVGGDECYVVAFCGHDGRYVMWSIGLVCERMERIE